MSNNKTGLILVKDTKFDKIRRKLLMFFWGKDYKIIEEFQSIIQVKRPKNIIIPKEIKWTIGTRYFVHGFACQNLNLKKPNLCVWKGMN